MDEEKDNLQEQTSDEKQISPLEDLGKAFSHLSVKFVIWGLILLSITVYFLSGIYVVNPGEQAVVKRFGRVIPVTITAGAHYRLPWPVDSVAKVNVKEVRREGVGTHLPEHEHPFYSPEKIQILTGDENIINVEAIVHYRIKDAARYLYNVNFSSERLIRGVVGSALVKLIGNMAVDDILTIEKLQAQSRILWQAQKALDNYDSGLQITTFNIKAIIPPMEVADAFRDVTTAREDKERMMNQAEGYRNSVIPEARGKAQARLSGAESYRIEVVNEAKGDARKFESILAEYQKNRKIYTEDVTRYRLYLETMEKILPRVRKFVVNSTKKNQKVNLKFISQQ